MRLLTWQQLHGVNELLRDTVEATTKAVAEADREFSRVPYAILKRIPITADSANLVEHVHQAISAGVYAGVLGINQVAAKATTRLLDRMERCEGPTD